MLSSTHGRMNMAMTSWSESLLHHQRHLRHQAEPKHSCWEPWGNVGKQAPTVQLLPLQIS
jgi:hypothetical protein